MCTSEGEQGFPPPMQRSVRGSKRPVRPSIHLSALQDASPASRAFSGPGSGSGPINGSASRALETPGSLPKLGITGDCLLLDSTHTAMNRGCVTSKTVRGGGRTRRWAPVTPKGLGRGERRRPTAGAWERLVVGPARPKRPHQLGHLAGQRHGRLLLLLVPATFDEVLRPAL